MGTKNWGYIAAYAALLIGSALTIIFAAKPLSSTVVSLALFGFNLAALMFLIPQTLKYIENLRDTQISANQTTAQANTQLAEAIQNTEIISDELSNLSTRLDQIEKAIASQSGNFDSITSAQNATVNATTELVSLHQKLQSKIHQLEEKTTQAITQAAKNTSAQSSQNDNSFTLKSALKGTANFTPLTVDDLIGPKLPDQMPTNTQEQAPTTEQAQAPQNTTEQTTKPQQLDLGTFSSNVQETSAQETEASAPARLRARLSIGENDVICVRGEGGGLDWQEGLPMRDLEDDLWEWVSQPTNEPITCQLYLNDEIAAFGEDISINSGQTLEISPSFPKIEV